MKVTKTGNRANRYDVVSFKWYDRDHIIPMSLVHQTVYVNVQTLLRSYDGREVTKEGTEEVQELVSRELGYRYFLR